MTEKPCLRMHPKFSVGFRHGHRDALCRPATFGAIAGRPAPAITEVAAEKIAAEELKDGKVLVVATFKLLGEARRVRFRMEQEDGAWKIADILGHDFTSLREALESTGGKSTPQAR